MNDVVQSNFGDFLGASVCHASVIYNNKTYAVSDITYDANVSNISLKYYEQGSSEKTPWKNSTNNKISSPSINVQSPVQVPAKVTAIAIKDYGVIIKNNTLVPAVSLFSALGVQMQVNPKNGDINLGYGNTKVLAHLNSKYANINGASSFYAVPPQKLNDKLMIPLQLVKDAFKLKVTVEYDTADYNTNYIKSITVLSDNKKVTVPVNDIYEKYKQYLGKTAWLIKPKLIIDDLYGNSADSKVKNLSQVTIKNITRSTFLSDYLDVYFFYKGQTLKAILEDTDFEFGIYTESPYKLYNFPDKYWRKIEDGIISIGMTTDMVYLSWGLYSSHLKDTYSWGTTDMWVYENSYGSDTYLHFTNGILESISDY